MLSGCSWAPVHEPSPPVDNGGWLSWGDARSGAPDPLPGPEAAGIVSLAEQMLGVPYRWGGRTPAGFDCSGLVQYTFERAGYRVPRTSREQHRAASPVPIGEARPGDLVFFAESGRVSHVGIYVGDGRFIHAPSEGQRVKVSSIREDWYRQRFAGAGRILPATESL
jgi:murein DD-endopeptidase